jgi:hypothetical protein
MNAMTQEQVRELAARLIQRYLELGEQARLAKGTLADMAGVSRTRFGQISKKSDSGISLYVFLRIRSACLLIGQELESGTLPAPSTRGGGQEHVAKQLLARFPD